MKKLTAILIAALMLFAIACDKQQNNNPEKPEETVEQPTEQPVEQEAAPSGSETEPEKEAEPTEEPEEEKTELNSDIETPEIDTDTYQIVGGWEIIGAGISELPEDLAAAFKSVTEQLLGATYQPVALLGTQVVAGMNYAILCTRTLVTANPVTDLAVLTIYVDLNGEAELLNIKDFDLGEYAQMEDPGAAEQLMGGWQASDEAEELTAMPQDAATAYAAAFDGFVGNTLVPVALLGKQLVAGTNYAFLCHSTLVTLEPVVSMQIVVIYQDLDGNATVTNIVTVNPADFN